MTGEFSGEWVGVDLDGTLSQWPIPNFPDIGPPIPAMVARVHALLNAGVEVRIFTARVCSAQDPDFTADQQRRVEAWCEVHLGRRLPVTANKDFRMVCLFDDRAVTVEQNTGALLSMPAALQALRLL